MCFQLLAHRKCMVKLFYDLPLFFSFFLDTVASERPGIRHGVAEIRKNQTRFVKFIVRL